MYSVVIPLVYWFSSVLSIQEINVHYCAGNRILDNFYTDAQLIDCFFPKNFMLQLNAFFQL